MALGNLLNSLGAKADANLISQIGGLTRQGISMHGLSQAASYYGINLVGLKIDSGQLKPNDIVLLNINENNHYALILGKLGNNYIIQDPFLGTVVMTTEQFNKYYTGNALTTNPNGRGTLLSVDEMKGLFGGILPAMAIGYGIVIGVEYLIAAGVIAAITAGFYAYRDQIWDGIVNAGKWIYKNTEDAINKANKFRKEQDARWRVKQASDSKPPSNFKKMLKDMANALSKAYKSAKEIKYIRSPKKVSPKIKAMALGLAAMVASAALGSKLKGPVSNSKGVKLSEGYKITKTTKRIKITIKPKRK